VDKVLPVDVYVPGCAARPESIIDGVVKGIGALEAEAKEERRLMDKQAFLARVGEYHKDGWRLALINATTVPSPDEAGPARRLRTHHWAFAKDPTFETIRETVTWPTKSPASPSSSGRRSCTRTRCASSSAST
jgi:hypothetical protein